MKHNFDFDILWDEEIMMWVMHFQTVPSYMVQLWEYEMKYNLYYWWVELR